MGGSFVNNMIEYDAEYRKTPDILHMHNEDFAYPWEEREENEKMKNLRACLYSTLITAVPGEKDSGKATAFQSEVEQKHLPLMWLQEPWNTGRKLHSTVAHWSLNNH